MNRRRILLRKKEGRKERKTERDSSVSASPQLCKQPRYELTKEQKQLIKADSVNKKVWDDVLTTVKAQGSVRFILLLVCISC